MPTAGPWVYDEYSTTWKRTEEGVGPVCEVFCVGRTDPDVFYWYLDERVDPKRTDWINEFGLEAAQKACDAELRRRGWTLQENP